MNSRIKSTVAVRIFMASMLTLLPSLGAVARATEHQGAFAGGGLGFGTTELSNEAYLYAVNPDKSVVVLEGHGGYRFNSYIAIEGQLLGSSNGNNSGFARISFAGLSARALAMAPLSDVVDLYAMLGFYTGSSEIGLSDTTHESGAVYGAGIELNFGDRGQYGVRGEYEVYKGSDLLDQLKAFTVSFQYNFFK